MEPTPDMDEIDRNIINRLQGGFPICERPYEEAARELGIGEELSRFGPMYHAEKLGGGLSLCAMAVPEEKFDAVAEQVNAFPEVAHNYARDHQLNMWFVLATETPERIGEVLEEIERVTGYRVYNMPKLEEFYVGLHFEL